MFAARSLKETQAQIYQKFIKKIRVGILSAKKEAEETGNLRFFSLMNVIMSHDAAKKNYIIKNFQGRRDVVLTSFITANM